MRKLLCENKSQIVKSRGANNYIYISKPTFEDPGFSWCKRILREIKNINKSASRSQLSSSHGLILESKNLFEFYFVYREAIFATCQNVPTLFIIRVRISRRFLYKACRNIPTRKRI